MYTLQTSAGPVAYDDLGAGPPVVMLHANLHDHHDFDPIVPALAREHRVIAVDWPGHGASVANSAVTAPLLADVLTEIVDSLDLTRAVFIGNSIGGFAAARLALDHPDRVAGLVLVNPGGFVPRTVFTRAYCRAYGSRPVARWLLPYLVPYYTKPTNDHDRALVARAVRAGATEHGRAVYSSLWRSFTDPAFDLSARAGEIAAPTLIVWGRRDPVVPERIGRKTHERIPGSRMAVLDTGHVPFSSAPQPFLEIVLPFVRSNQAAAQ
ncbi:alpha/beta fold hydrolase [Nocardia sp. N2S4-5]|uniref:alpha/beta fold hydrolase n=1 Tax=Nocardia sp. N2S4-5 TaxID=3351565 RepID=UPI0037D87C92